MPSSKPERRLNDILDNVASIEEALGGRTEADLAADTVLQDAILFRLLRISEAATKLGEQAEQLVPDQPWRQIRSLGNHLRHEYDDIALDQIWIICRRDLPRLAESCRRALGL